MADRKAARKVGSLLESVAEADSASSLHKMEVEERLVADYHGTGMMVGPHPMAYQRSALRAWKSFRCGTAGRAAREAGGGGGAA